MPESLDLGPARATRPGDINCGHSRLEGGINDALDVGVLGDGDDALLSQLIPVVADDGVGATGNTLKEFTEPSVVAFKPTISTRQKKSTPPRTTPGGSVQKFSPVSPANSGEAIVAAATDAALVP